MVVQNTIYFLHLQVAWHDVACSHKKPFVCEDRWTVFDISKYRTKLQNQRFIKKIILALFSSILRHLATRSSTSSEAVPTSSCKKAVDASTFVTHKWRQNSGSARRAIKKRSPIMKAAIHDHRSVDGVQRIREKKNSTINRILPHAFSLI